MEYLENNPEIVLYQYESIKIPYYYNENKRWYIPDFIVNNKIIEIKPQHLVEKDRNLAKFSAARAYCSANNMQFEVITEVELKQLGIL